MRSVLGFVVRCFVVGGAVLFAAAPARAQVVTGIVGGVTRIEPGGANADLPDGGGYSHPGGVPVNTVNYVDCEADLSYVFQLGLSGDTSSYKLTAWAGTQDCTPYAARNGASAACWPLAPRQIPQAPLPATVFLRAQDLVAATESVGATSYAPATSAVCTASGPLAATGLTVYFFFVDANDNAIGTAQAYPITVDVRSQNIVGAVAFAPGDGQETITINAAPDPDTVTWNIYCDPNPANGEAGTPPNTPPSSSGECTDAANGASVGDASADADGGDAESGGDGESEGSTDGAISDADASPGAVHEGGCGIGTGEGGTSATGANGCPLTNVIVSGGGTTTWTLEDGGLSEAGAQLYIEAGTTSGGTQSRISTIYLCGSAPANQTSLTVSGLTNATLYNIGVAAVDNAGNVGPLAITCALPKLIPDFFGDYALDGGQAGGGFCSTEGAGVPAGTTGLGLVMVAGAAGMIRRRRRSAPRV